MTEAFQFESRIVIHTEVRSTSAGQPAVGERLSTMRKPGRGLMFSKQMQAAAAMLAVSLINVAAAQEYAAPAAPYGQIQQAQNVVVETPTRPGTYVPGGQYPQLNAPLYPSPVQYTPSWNGGTVITNQAFAPHEMLYPHTYHAMYPPFYHKVKGGWFWTPFGFRQHEHWELQGTEVTVKYRSHYPLFGGWHPPNVR